MYKTLRRRRVVLFAFVFLLCAQFLSPLYIASPQKAYADENLDQLCVLPTNQLSGDDHEQDGWLEIQFINRAIIRARFAGSGNCVTPSGRDVAFIHGSKRFAELMDGDYYDRNTGDGTFSYVKGAGDAQSDDSRFDNFDDGFDEAVGDPFGGQDKGVSADTIRNNISDIEFTLSIEEDEVEGVTCSAQNGNFVFTNINGDGNGFIWDCTSGGDSSVGPLKGVRVRNAFMGQLENFNITYNYQDGKIVHVSEGERNNRTFTFCESEGKFRSDDCTGDLYIDVTTEQLDALATDKGVFSMRKDGESAELPITIAGSTSASAGATTDIAGSVGVDTGAPTCESEGGSLSWIICPLISLGDSILQKLDEGIIDLLTVPNSYIDEVENPGLERTWSRMRDIAYILLVPIVLVMVIGTALGFEFVSAYTVKRALPRLVAATMFIALSFEIGKFLVVLTNNVSVAIHNLVLSAFTGSTQVTLASVFSPDGADSGIGALALIAAGGALAAIGSIGIVASYIFVAVIALGIGFLLLSFRQLLIIALLILAPVAILAWIFPGNDKLWKLWWGTFSKLLLLFPLVMILIAVGKSFAVMVADTDGSFASTIIKLIAYVGPYFLIPSLFKLAGGVFATVSGMANDRGRGLFDRNKKYRQEKAGKNWSEFKTGDRAWRPQSFNTLGRRVGAGAKGGYGFGKRGAAAFDIRSRSAAQAAMKDPLMEQLQFDDDGILAMSLSGGSRDGAKSALVAYRNRLAAAGKTEEAAKWDDDRINKAVATAAAVGFSRSNATAAIDMMGRNKSFSLSGGAVGMETMLDATSRLAGGNQQMADNLMGSFEFNSRQAGRMDLGMHDYKNGTPNIAGAWSKATLSQHAQSAGPSLGVFADDIKADLASGDQAKQAAAAVRALEMQSMLPYAHAGNQEVITSMMNEIGIDYTKGPVEEQLAQLINFTSGGTRVADVKASELRGNARVYDREDGRDIENRRGPAEK